ncbi:MAG TPA: sodium:solute symporter family protein, partial [Verrucomicrobiota bacterium]|nr:sodium:solute symporter family protein [Verrucomicrobiota bacterium]
KELSNLTPLVPQSLQAIGHRGWTSMPEFGFGDVKYNLWWIIVSTIVMGVGIGVIAQPQLVVRFMTVKSKRELNRAVGIGGLFILVATLVAYITGSLSNAYFTHYGPLFTGRVVNTVNEERGQCYLQLMKQDTNGKWLDVADVKAADGKTVVTNVLLEPMVSANGNWLPVAKSTNSNGNVIEGKVIPAVLDKKEPAISINGSPKIVKARSISIVVAKGNDAQIIPTYITMVMPKWYSLLFMLTLLAAAMSTLSSQYHTIGTAVGRDVIETLSSNPNKSSSTVLVVRVAILIGLIIAVLISKYGRSETIIARATAIFFGLCASTFLPAFLGGLFWKRMTKAGVISSMIVGFVITTFWMLFVKVPEISAFKLVSKSILADKPNWPVVDPLMIALPASILTAVVVSLLTTPPDEKHLQRCFNNNKQP